MVRRRSRQPQGMESLFDLEPLTRHEDDSSARRTTVGERSPTQRKSPPQAAMPVPYSVRGVFRFGNGDQRTRAVDGVGMRTQLREDAMRFVFCLMESGWLFPEGRAVLVELLGVAAHDGGLVIVASAPG